MVMIVTNFMFSISNSFTTHYSISYSDLEFYQNCMFLIFIIYNVGGLVSGKSLFVVLST